MAKKKKAAEEVAPIVVGVSVSTAMRSQGPYISKFESCVPVPVWSLHVVVVLDTATNNVADAFLASRPTPTTQDVAVYDAASFARTRSVPLESLAGIPVQVDVQSDFDTLAPYCEVDAIAKLEEVRTDLIREIAAVSSGDSGEYDAEEGELEDTTAEVLPDEIDADDYEEDVRGVVEDDDDDEGPAFNVVGDDGDLPFEADEEDLEGEDAEDEYLDEDEYDDEDEEDEELYEEEGEETDEYVDGDEEDEESPDFDHVESDDDEGAEEHDEDDDFEVVPDDEEEEDEPEPPKPAPKPKKKPAEAKPAAKKASSDPKTLPRDITELKRKLAKSSEAELVEYASHAGIGDQLIRGALKMKPSGAATLRKLIVRHLMKQSESK